MRYLVVVVLLFVAAGCSSDTSDVIADATNDTRETDIGGGDTSSDVASSDASADVSQDVSGADVGVDRADGATSEITFAAVRNDERWALTEAYFGRNLDGSFHVELYIGGTGTCPLMDDPTPDLAAIIAFAAGSEAALTFLNYSELLGDGVAYRATPSSDYTHEISGDAVLMTAMFSFENDDLIASGGFTATHCTSLDET